MEPVVYDCAHSDIKDVVSLVAEDVAYLDKYLVNYHEGKPFSLRHFDIQCYQINEMKKMRKEIDELKRIINGIKDICK